jgi:hypothetical protein
MSQDLTTRRQMLLRASAGLINVFAQILLSVGVASWSAVSGYWSLCDFVDRNDKYVTKNIINRK